MATTDPLTNATIQDQSDAATGGTQIGNVVKNLRSYTVPRFTSTTARDTAYTSFTSGGGTMADGMMCTANGIPYRRIGGNWRIDRPRVFNRPVTGLTGGTGTPITSGGAAETGLTSPIALSGGASFTLYEAGSVHFVAFFRAGGAGAAQCTIKVNGSTVGNVAISRSDGTVGCQAIVALAAGSNSVALRVDAIGGSVNWIDAILCFSEYTAE